MALPDLLTFRGRPLLLMMPHAVDSRPLVLTVRGEATEVATGARTVETDPAIPGGTHQLDFVAETRADIRLLEDFFDARQGACEGFWVPTWQWEFDVAPYDAGFGNAVWIRPAAYASLFALGAAFRYLLLLYADRYTIQLITDVTADNPTGTGFERLGTSEQQSTSGGFGVAKPWTEAKGVRPLWLRYVRFADDELETQELGADSALITVHVVERPGETP